jgi:hypothetical protein
MYHKTENPNVPFMFFLQHLIGDLRPISGSSATGKQITGHVAKLDVPWLVVVKMAACLGGHVDGSAGNGLL